MATLQKMSSQQTMRYLTFLQHMGQLLNAYNDGKTRTTEHIVDALRAIVTLVSPTKPNEWDIVQRDVRRILHVWASIDTSAVVRSCSEQILDILREFSSLHNVSPGWEESYCPVQPSHFPVDRISHIHDGPSLVIRNPNHENVHGTPDLALRDTMPFGKEDHCTKDGDFKLEKEKCGWPHVVVIPSHLRYHMYACKVVNRLRAEGISVKLDISGEALQRKLRSAQEDHAFIFIVGEKEQEEGCVFVRTTIDNIRGSISLDKAVELLLDLQKEDKSVSESDVVEIHSEDGDDEGSDEGEEPNETEEKEKEEGDEENEEGKEENEEEKEEKEENEEEMEVTKRFIRGREYWYDEKTHKLYEITPGDDVGPEVGIVMLNGRPHFLAEK
jgi:hypothetical protein